MGCRNSHVHEDHSIGRVKDSRLQQSDHNLENSANEEARKQKRKKITSSSEPNKVIVYILPDDEGLDACCRNSAGEKICSLRFSLNDTVGQLATTARSRLQWFDTDFLSETGDEVKLHQQLKDFSALTMKRVEPDVVSRELFALDVKLPDGREVRAEGLSQRTSCLEAKREVFKSAGLDLCELDEYVLIYYEQWLDGEEYPLNWFGLPWNGTQCELRKKQAVLTQLAEVSGWKNVLRDQL